MYLLLALCVVLLTAIFYRRSKKHDGTLLGKTLFITGCDTGFGRLMALKYCEEGAHVFAACLTKEASETLAAEATGKGQITTLLLDVTDETQIQTARDFTESALKKDGKRLYGLINNAGIFSGWFAEMTEMAEYKRVMDVNFFGTVCVTKMFLPLMQHPGGRIIVISSCSAAISTPCFSAYASSKFAVNAFFDALRRELVCCGFHVVKIMPGMFSTSIAQNARTQLPQERYSNATSDVLSRYPSDLLSCAEEQATRAFSHAGHPIRVVDCVRDALLCRRPATRMFIGHDAIWLVWPLSLLPESWVDAFLYLGQRKLR